ncbi:uncharacterized protein LOC129592657 [Paramacrobiotus metropolitanus]|uniref:uncharacterized protein LOC129592657 n=1 Tax=Paramacrobiotus metropolitanus TaxID=2943436 RepID=UPI0024463BDF|nr:uncharacterized protein LOC129592657 [Paramacrobiotus metropolitanus]
MYKTEKRLARTVARYELPKLLPWLKSKFPKSLPVYHLIKNALREDWAWPGLEVIVDSYPHPSICICRSTEINGKLVSGQYVFIYAKTHQFFLNFVRNHFQEIANWKATATFIDVDTEVAQILLNHNQQFTQGIWEIIFGLVDHVSTSTWQFGAIGGIRYKSQSIFESEISLSSI